MTKIKHPTLPVSRDVKDPASWLAAGWALDTPTPEPNPEPTEDAPKPSRRHRKG